MKVLLDSHALLWLAEGDSKLSKTAVEVLTDPQNDLLISPASYWEIAIKISIGNYQLSDPLATYFEEAMGLYDLTVLPIKVSHAEALVNLPYHHRDPFDRMLIAQAMVERIPLISVDNAFDAYAVQRLW